jgi:hypothetical protein
VLDTLNRSLVGFESNDKDMALYIRASVWEQTISLWERDRKKPIPPLAGVMLRLLYAEHIGLKPKIERTIRAQTRSKEKTVRLDRAARRWKATEAHAY